MKKFLLIAVFLVAAMQGFAYFNQSNWRWYKDDAASTPIKGENKSITVNNTDNLRLRILLYNDGSQQLSQSAVKLQYTIDTDSLNWVTISNATSNAFVLSPSSFVTDGSATSQALTTQGEEFAFVAGKHITTSLSAALKLQTNQQTEWEYCIKPTSFALPAHYYYFRAIPDDVSSGLYVNPIPTLYMQEILPVTISSFTVAKENEQAVIRWATATESNNRYFEVLRSSDGKTNWQKIDQQNGQGTSTIAHQYVAYDKTPFEGMNYYKIRQVDYDNKFSETAVKNLLMHLVQEAGVKIVPNPVKGNLVRLQLSGFTGNKVLATIVNLAGRQVFSTTLLLNGGSDYQLAITNPLPAGTYILRLKGENGTVAMAKMIKE